ncbi:MAG: hypothetical protein IJU90_05960 [Bacteroidales bacterium]|nr:hypothetical protein [Bacteroidales bacterium]
MVRKILFVLTITLLSFSANAQYVRLNKATDNASLYLSTDRIFNYNRYDGAHFEASFYIAYPNDNSEKGRTALHQWQVSAFAGYGQRSHAATYGGSVALQSKQRRKWRPELSYRHDMLQAGATSLEEYHVFDIAHNAMYMTDRYALTDIVSVSLTGYPTSDIYLAARVSHSLERNLYAADGALLYDSIESLPLCRYSEAHLRATYRNSLSVDITGGTCHNTNSEPYLRAIAQYNKKHVIHPLATMNVFAQAGYTTTVPYSRLFNLSGTWGCPIFFENTMMTTSPNEFHAHLYARATLHLATSQPLWDATYSSPTPFLQIGAMAGWLADGKNMTDHAIIDGIAVDAPTEGILEPAIGIKSLLKWGLIEIGAAAAYRLTPPTAYYHRPKAEDNIAVMATAQLLL